MTAPANVHEKIRKIVSLLSRALVLTLSLLKDMVVVAGDTKSIKNVDPMVLEDGQQDDGQQLEPGLVGLEQARVFNRNRWIFGSHA